MLSYRSWIGKDGAELSSPQEWTTPLTNLATRQLAEFAQPVPEDNTVSIEVTLGSERAVGCIALLGIDGFDVTGNTLVTVSRVGASMAYTVPSLGSYGETNGMSDLIFLTPTGWLTSAVTVSISNITDPPKIGRLWVGPVLGLMPGAALNTIPNVYAGWTQGVADPGALSSSPAGQRYARSSRRLRTVDAEFGDLSYAEAFFDADSPYRVGLDWVARAYGNTEPMVFCSRIDALGALAAMQVRANHAVYGAQTLPWQIQQTSNSPASFRCAMRFQGEA